MQFATYKFAESQSESIEHTILKSELKPEHFEGGMDSDILDRLNSLRLAKNIQAVRAVLPESFIQRRIVTTNMESIRNILHQRKEHRMSEWRIFCEDISSEICGYGQAWLLG